MKNLFENFASTKNLEESLFKVTKVKVEYVSKYDVAILLKDEDVLWHLTDTPEISTGRNEMVHDYIEEVLSYYKNIIEEIENVGSDSVEIIEVSHNRILYEILGIHMSIDSNVVYDYINKELKRNPALFAVPSRDMVKKLIDEL